MKCSQTYRNVFDPSVNNMNGRFADGTFTRDFDKNKKMSYITEGTPWQYNWYVPQDVEGLISLYIAILSAPGNSEKNCYIKSVRFDGKEIGSSRFSHFDLMNGGIIEYEMTGLPPE